MGGLSNSIKRRGRGLAALGVVVGAGLAFMAPVTSAGASSGGKLYVNATSGHDTGTCRLSSHPCRTIVYALTQATEDSTIEVASGSYPQQLVINTDVTIAGPTSGQRAVVNPTSLPVVGYGHGQPAIAVRHRGRDAWCHRQAEEPHDQRRQRERPVHRLFG